MKKISMQEAFSLGVQTSFHLFIKDKGLLDNSLKMLEEKGVLWKSDKKPSKLKAFMATRVYPVVLTVNKTAGRCYYMTYAEGVANPSCISENWGAYSTKGYINAGEETLSLKIKRKNKI